MSNCIIITGLVYFAALWIHNIYFEQCFGSCKFCRYFQMTKDENWGHKCNFCLAERISDICYEERQAMMARINNRIAELEEINKKYNEIYEEE